jgi:hypothetical protein
VRFFAILYFSVDLGKIFFFIEGFFEKVGGYHFFRQKGSTPILTYNPLCPEVHDCRGENRQKSHGKLDTYGNEG